MVANTAEQFNSNYIRLPKNGKLSGLAFGLQKVIGEIFSFTGKAKGGKVLSCHRTYKKFEERCGVSRATVGRALKEGRKSNLIQGNNKQGFEYKIAADNVEFNRLPSWICQEEFAVRENDKRKLTNSEQKLYAVLYTRCTNKKNGKHDYSASIATLADEAGLSERTVQRALWTLIRANLIYRPKEDKGINAYKVSRYILNYKLVLLKEKTANQRRKEVEKELAKVEDEPFPEFTSAAKEGEEEFILHAPSQSRVKRNSKKSKAKRKIVIPEMEIYKVGSDEYEIPIFDFSAASDDELKNIFNLYSPSWEFLSIFSEHFLSLIHIELDRRAGTSPPQEG